MTILASDSLNRTANATSLGTSDSYAGGTAKSWVVIGTAVYGIDANGYAYCSTKATSGHGAAYWDTGNSDGSITATIRNIAGDYPKLAFRISDAENFLFVEHQIDANQLQLRKYVGGSGTTISTKTSLTLSASDVIKITANGSTIQVYLNGTLVITATDTFNQTATKWGFNSYSYTNTRFDNFIIEDLNTGGTPTTQDGTVSIIGTGTLASTGRILKNSSASLVGTGSLSATATKLQNALASMVGTGTLTATPVKIKNGQASVVGQGLFIANASTQSGIVIVDGNASLLGNGVLGATATTIIQGNASLLGQGTFASNGIRETFGSVSFIGNGLFNVDLREITIVTGEAWLIGSGLLEARAQGRTWEDAPYLTVPMYAVVQATEKNWKEVIQEKVKF